MKFDEGRKKILQNKQTTIKQQQHKTTFLSFPGDESQFLAWQCNGGPSSTPLSLNILWTRFYKAKQDLEAVFRWYIWWYL